jgi:NADH-quinone oxidoreductase subunit J
MDVAFYVAAVIAVVATLMAISRLNAVHGLLYLIVSLLAIALTFGLLGAPFIAALEVIVYAGAIMMLFVFAVMMLNLGPRAIQQEGEWLPRGAWVGPAILGLILVAEVVVLVAGGAGREAGRLILPQVVGAALFGPYLVAVELGGLLLFAALVGAYYLGQGFGRGEG